MKFYILLCLIIYVKSEECQCKHGKCISKELTMECLCNYGWDGILCDYRICEPIIDCYSLIGHGICNENTKECICNKPWMGYICNVKYCNTLNCNEGICITEQLNFTNSIDYCECPNNWEGPFCNIPICYNIPINSICIYPPNKYICKDNFFGLFCNNSEESIIENEESIIESIIENEYIIENKSEEFNKTLITIIFIILLIIIIGIIIKKNNYKKKEIIHLNEFNIPIIH